ncbi:MAG: multiheme c-type cytochrome [Bacillota bacterium]|nr:multiheme c-type cytochrome [Bacillota bacterium]MDW7684211.1 multiheme c-type cytochrome [Bacillota bacterium]
MRRLWLLFVFGGLLILMAGSVYAADSSCRECHVSAAEDFARGSKAETMLCTDCHGTDHDGPGTGEPFSPTPKTCAGCHEGEVSAFNAGKHYWGWEAMQSVPTYEMMPAAVTDKGCVVCHQVGYIWDDGSRGRCDSCHTRHVFSAEEAKKPEACGTCHTGDHPQYEMWANSKHGKLYQMEGDSGRAPTCVTCHGGHEVMTAWGFLGLRPGDDDDDEWVEAREKVKQALETMGPARAPEIMRESMAEWQYWRDDMVARCSECHAESFVLRELAKGDALVREADIMKAKIIDVADMLFAEGLIDEQTRFGIYRESTAHRFATFMGGFHNSALYAWDKGYLGLATDIVHVRDDAITTKKLSVIRGKIGQLTGIAGGSGILALLALGYAVYTRRGQKKEQPEQDKSISG